MIPQSCGSVNDTVNVFCVRIFIFALISKVKVVLVYYPQIILFGTSAIPIGIKCLYYNYIHPQEASHGTHYTVRNVSGIGHPKKKQNTVFQ